MKRFKPGDKVRLIYGSDEMTIHAVFGQRLIECEWTNVDGTTYRNSFRPEYVELVSSEVNKTSADSPLTEKITQ